MQLSKQAPAGGTKSFCPKNTLYAIWNEDGGNIQPHLQIGVMIRCTRDELTQLVLGPAATTAGGALAREILEILVEQAVSQQYLSNVSPVSQQYLSSISPVSQ